MSLEATGFDLIVIGGGSGGLAGASALPNMVRGSHCWNRTCWAGPA